MDEDDIISGKRWTGFIRNRLDEVARSQGAEREKALRNARSDLAILAEIMGCELIEHAAAPAPTVQVRSRDLVREHRLARQAETERLAE